MRILITTLHFHPLVPVARALEAAGHVVAFVCSEDNRPAVEATHFPFFPAGTSMRELMPTLIPQVMAAPATRDTWMMGEVFGGILPERILPDLLTICRDWSPDLLLRDAIEFGGCIAAEHLGLPHASVEVTACVFARGSMTMLAHPIPRKHSMQLCNDPWRPNRGKCIELCRLLQLLAQSGGE